MNGHESPRHLSIEDLYREARIDLSGTPHDCLYDLAEVFYEVNLCRHGVILIDSPGLNEEQSRAKITLDYLPNVDTAVFLTSSHAALGQQEVDALCNGPQKLDTKRPFLRWWAALKMKESQCPEHVRVTRPV